MKGTYVTEHSIWKDNCIVILSGNAPSDMRSNLTSRNYEYGILNAAKVVEYSGHKLIEVSWYDKNNKFIQKFIHRIDQERQDLHHINDIYQIEHIEELLNKLAEKYDKGGTG